MSAIDDGDGLRWLRVRHETRYRYDGDIEGACHLAHLRPRETAAQQVRGWSLRVTPHPDAGVELASGIRETQDPWGNARQTFAHSEVHDRLDVVSTFDAGVVPPVYVSAGDGAPWREVAQSLRYHAGVSRADTAAFEAAEFTLSSTLAPAADALAAWAAPVAGAHDDIVGLALGLMHRVHQQFTYRPFSTSVATGALEALAQREGVCQDYAHVMIGALRSLGLAARYVSGYLLTHPAEGQARLVGADASHAWVAVWCPPHGWIALDPTNDVTAAQDHVTLGWGRDYEDVAPLRGVIRGAGWAAPEVAVTVEPLDAAEVARYA
jgi:transglutaminase-like putative cysteine protease